VISIRETAVNPVDKMVKKIKEFPSIFFLFSPDGKAKIQLQIVLHDGNSTTFHFVNPAGTKTIGNPPYIEDPDPHG
jgi:hypothetical protein